MGGWVGGSVWVCADKSACVVEVPNVKIKEYFYNPPSEGNTYPILFIKYYQNSVVSVEYKMPVRPPVCCWQCKGRIRASWRELAHLFAFDGERKPRLRPRRGKMPAKKELTEKAGGCQQINNNDCNYL